MGSNALGPKGFKDFRVVEEVVEAETRVNLRLDKKDTIMLLELHSRLKVVANEVAAATGHGPHLSCPVLFHHCGGLLREHWHWRLLGQSWKLGEKSPVQSHPSKKEEEEGAESWAGKVLAVALT